MQAEGKDSGQGQDLIEKKAQRSVISLVKERVFVNTKHLSFQRVQFCGGDFWYIHSYAAITTI